MGLFDLIKKKKNAKKLGLSVEQYDEYIEAIKLGISLKEFKRYLSSLSDKINLVQFVDYLRLEKYGISDQQIMHYLLDLSSNIKVEDYPEFLEAEKLGLSIFDYVVYSNTLKKQMSAVEYLEFLKVQKIGVTLSKYLGYLECFKDAMTFEEYEGYLQAEKQGIDREHYIEYIREYKDTFSIERYLEFDKARTLGITLEEYDLQIEASKKGMSIEQYKNHIEAEKLGMSNDEYKAYLDLLNDNDIANEVLVIPESMTELPKNVFKHFNFKSVVFNSVLTKIPEGVFVGCESLMELNIPENIKSIGKEAFKGCISLHNLTLHHGLEEINDCAFEDCISLKEVMIPGTVQNVGYHAFFSCNKLERIEFEYGVGTIDVSGWIDLPSLTEVISPATASLHHLPPFKTNDPRYGIINPKRLHHMNSENSETKIDYVVPSNYSVYGIEENKNEIEYLRIYGDYVFLNLDGFKKLKTIEFSCKGAIRSVKDCPSLQMILYSDYIAEIPTDLVTSEKKQEEKNIEAKTLTMTTFDAPSLRFVVVNDGASVIDLDNVEGFKLALLHVPASCSRIGINTPVISAIAIHGNCKIISDRLNKTNNLAVIRFDKDVYENGFYSNSGAKRILPAKFSHCGLLDIKFDCDKINAEHFGMQTSVKAIQLPHGIKDISDNTFEGWGINRITILETVEKIGNNVFMDCLELKDVVFAGIPQKIGCNLFEGCNLLEKIEINSEKLNVSEFVDRYEEKSGEIRSSIAISKECEERKADTYEGVRQESFEDGVVKDVFKGMTVSFADHLNLILPESYICSVDPDIIGDNRALVAVLNDEQANLSNPYTSTESLIILYGKDISSISEADSVAEMIGITNGIILTDNTKLNIRYELKENGENLTIYHALICTENHSFSAQFFFNNCVTEKDDQIIKILNSISYGSVTTPKAYGYTISEDILDQESSNPVLLVEELKNRYPNGSCFNKVNDLRSANSDIASQFNDLESYVNSVFDISLEKYLIQNGILLGNADDQGKYEFRVLQSRYEATPFVGNLAELKKINDDIDWNAISKYVSLSGSTESLKDFLINQGVLVEQMKSLDDELKEITEELKKRYSERQKFSGSIEQLKVENRDLPISNLYSWTMQVHKQTPKDYLIRAGIMEGPETDEDKLIAVTETLKERYASQKKKAHSIMDLHQQNLDLPITKIGTWTKKIFNKNATEYLLEQGIISEYDWKVNMHRLEEKAKMSEEGIKNEKYRSARINGKIKYN